MKDLNTLLIILLLCSCKGQAHTHTEAKNTTERDTVKKVFLKNEIYGSNEYAILLLWNPDNDLKEINIVNGNKNIATISLPTQDEFSGFSLDKIDETSEGFMLSAEYGSRFYFRKSFYFKFTGEHFLLYQVESKSFDKYNTEEESQETKAINPPIDIESFKIADYLSD